MTSDDKTQISGSAQNIVRGTQLNGIYEIDEHFATGGMGEVYRGHNIQTLDPVAIKAAFGRLGDNNRRVHGRIHPWIRRQRSVTREGWSDQQTPPDPAAK